MADFWTWLSLHVEWKNEPLEYWWSRYKEEVDEGRLKDIIPSMEHFVGLLVLNGFEVKQNNDVWVFKPKHGNRLIPNAKRLIIC